MIFKKEHVYSILKTVEINVENHRVRILNLFNPNNGKSEWDSFWSDA